MIPPVLRRFLIEDYPDAPLWFGRFIQTLNAFMEQTVQLFDKNISFGENIFARRYAFSFTTDAAYAGGTFVPISYSWSGSALPLMTLIASITQENGVPILTSVGIPNWTYVNRTVKVTYIPGLSPGVKYNVTLLTF